MHLLSVFSLRNRALIALVTIVVGLFGGIALTSLKQELIPSVSFPQVIVLTHDPLVATVNARISRLLGLPEEYGELIQGQRYASGQEFKPHTDTFNPGGADFFLHTAEAGQRTWTAMAYLNEPEEGGATRFKKIGKTIHPEAGKLIVWNNLLADGSPNPATLHQGMKVRRDTKYVLTKWFRQAPWPLLNA